MATTSIWAVKGWLGKVVLYIENPEKTENPQFYRQKDMTDAQTQNLSDVIDYAARSDKTTAALDSESVPILRQLVSGINCLPATARDEMLAVKKRFGKEDGVVAYHGYQSFAPGEATPELAHEIGVKLARKLWDEKYQVLVSTHLDKENHLHSHFVVNTVSFVDGIRYHRTGKDYYEMRTVSDELCREYGLSVVEKPQLGKSKHYGEWRAEQEQRPTWRDPQRNRRADPGKRQRKAVLLPAAPEGLCGEVRQGHLRATARKGALCAPCPELWGGIHRRWDTAAYFVPAPAAGSPSRGSERAEKSLFYGQVAEDAQDNRLPGAVSVLLL